MDKHHAAAAAVGGCIDDVAIVDVVGCPGGLEGDVLGKLVGVDDAADEDAVEIRKVVAVDRRDLEGEVVVDDEGGAIDNVEDVDPTRRRVRDEDPGGILGIDCDAVGRCEDARRMKGIRADGVTVIIVKEAVENFAVPGDGVLFDVVDHHGPTARSVLAEGMLEPLRDNNFPVGDFDDVVKLAVPEQS